MDAGVPVFAAWIAADYGPVVVVQSIYRGLRQSPPCYQFAGLNGADYFWQLILVGIPVLVLIPMLFTLVPMAIRGLVQGRFSPEGEKVYKPTLVIRGAKAYVKPVLYLTITVACVLLIWWGHQQAAIMPALDSDKLAPALCQSDT